MHEELFNSPERPFRATPDARFYFPYDSIEGARQTAVRAVLRAEGPEMVLGGAGLGKSLLGMVVAQELASRFDIVQLHAARLCSRRALLQNILFELQLPYRDLSEGDLRLSILTRLEPSEKYAPQGVLMIVDEAHTLPAKLLDELRLINNFTRNNQPRTRLLLIGNLRLEHTFAEPQMESFNQRLAARCYLQPMNRQQTCDYIRHQLTVAGLNPKQLITEEAMQTVYSACDGVPRLTNQVMDHALALAITRNQCPVSAALVEEAWSDLQQLPAPWHVGADKSPLAATHDDQTANAVEFGTLDDDQPWPADDDHACESYDAPATTQAPGFFTAFAPPEDSAADIRLAADSFIAADQPADKSASSADAKDPLVRPRVVFDANEAFAFSRNETPQVPVVNASPVVDDAVRSIECDTRNQGGLVEPSRAPESFFSNRPTDEQLLALMDEQHGYDAMGVWENDPPLSQRASQSANLDQPIFHHTPGTSQLFGDDFEVEESLTANDSGSVPVIANSARQAAEAADYISRIEQFANSVNAAASDRPRQQQQIAEEAATTAGLDIWTLDVASIDSVNEAAVYEDIEDMVSQLNFAAFSVEPFSVEQIPIESTSQPARPASDSSRTGPNDEIYTMHRPLEARAADEARGEGLFAASADDDRDLLVIEEELPLATKTADEKDHSVTKIAPYSQLFAKLRK